MSCLPEPMMHSGDTGQQIPFFDSCQLITTWVSNTKFYTDSIKVCHFPSTNMKGWTYIRTYSVQTIFSEPKFLGSIVTIFSYLWCSTARAPLKYMRNVNMMYKTVYCNSTSIYHCLNCYSKLYSSTIDEPAEVPCIYLFYLFYYFPTIKITQALHYTKMWRGDLRKPQGLYEEAPSLQ